MKLTKELFIRLKLKATKSNSRFPIAALGFNKKNECVIISVNKKKFFY